MRRLLLSICCALAGCSDPPDERPEDQRRFSTAIIAAASEYVSAGSNEFLRNSARNRRRDALCRILPGRQIRNWLGRVVSVSATFDGSAALHVRTSMAEFRTLSSAWQDPGKTTLIPAESPLLAKVSKMKAGEVVRFSGTVLPDSQDCFREGSVTESGGMNEPEFIMTFTDVH